MSKKLRNALMVSVMGVSSLALGNAGLLALPDSGGGGGKHEPQQVVRLAALTTPAAMPVCEAPDAAKLREQQLRAKLEALGLMVD